MTGVETAVLTALAGQREPLTEEFVSMKADLLMTDRQLLELADDGLLSVWARWWKKHPPSLVPAYALTALGAAAVASNDQPGQATRLGHTEMDAIREIAAGLITEAIAAGMPAIRQDNAGQVWAERLLWILEQNIAA